MTTELCKLLSTPKCCFHYLIFASLNEEVVARVQFIFGVLEEVVVNVHFIWNFGLAFGRDPLNNVRMRPTTGFLGDIISYITIPFKPVCIDGEHQYLVIGSTNCNNVELKSWIAHHNLLQVKLFTRSQLWKGASLLVFIFSLDMSKIFWGEKIYKTDGQCAPLPIFFRWQF